MQPDGPLRIQIGEEEAGRPLGELVAAALGGQQATALLAHGGLWVGKRRIHDGSTPAAAGDQLTLHRPPAGRYQPPLFDPAWLIYETNDLLALNKPAGHYVDVTPWDVFGNLRVALERFLAERDGAPPPLHLVHRLDRDTSGVLLFSKNPAVNAALQASFVGGVVHKTYGCLCTGDLAATDVELMTGHGRSAHGLFRVYPREEIGQELPNGSRVKAMLTRFEIERRLGDATLVQATPHTGRTHQIRLHLAYLGHPLLGDMRYGGPSDWRAAALDHHLLHAERMQLPNPRGGPPLLLVAPAPAWLSAARHTSSLLPPA